MASIEKKFMRSMYRNTGGFLPTWPIGRQVQLGDLVTIRFKRMQYLGNVADPSFGIQIIPQMDHLGDNARWQGKDSVDIKIKAKGAIPAVGSNLPIDKAGITLEFSSRGGFLFEPKGIKYHRIGNLASIRQEIIKKITASNLGGVRKVYLITEVAEVQSYALTISNSDNGKLEVAVNNADAAELSDLTKPAAELSIVTQNSLEFNQIGQTGGNVFFKGEKFKLKAEKRHEITASDPTLAFFDADILTEAMLSKITDGQGPELVTLDDISLEYVDQLLGVEEA